MPSVDPRARVNAGSRDLAVSMAALSLMLLLSACAVEVREPAHEVDGIYGEELYAPDPAPPPQSEVIVGVAPGPNHIWVGGYWSRYRDQWFWVRGRWAARPHPNAVWDSGHWDHHSRGGYVWRSGRWR